MTSERQRRNDFIAKRRDAGQIRGAPIDMVLVYVSAGSSIAVGQAEITRETAASAAEVKHSSWHIKIGRSIVFQQAEEIRDVMGSRPKKHLFFRGGDNRAQA